MNSAIPAAVPSTPDGDAAPAAAKPRSARSAVSYPPPRLNAMDLAWRYCVVIGWMAVQILVVVLRYVLWTPEADYRRPPLGFLIASIGVGLAGLVLVHFRRRFPVAVCLILALTTALGAVTEPAMVWAFASLATRRRWRQLMPMAFVVMLCQLAAQFNTFGAPANVFLSGPETSRMWPLALFSALGVAATEVALALAVGSYVGARRDLMASLRDRVQQAELEQEVRVLHGQAEERNRIAREMHDVLAHRISLVSMHAGILAYRDNLTPEETKQIAQTIQENASASLTELRSVLGTLRAPLGPIETWAPPEKPQPSLRDIPRLVEDARAAGVRVDENVTIERPELMPVVTGRHAYRIVQEGLTNARKHAAGAKVELILSGAVEHGLTIIVRNDLRNVPSIVPGAGVGLVGLSERAQVTGGTITHGITPAGQFELKAWLPW